MVTALRPRRARLALCGMLLASAGAADAQSYTEPADQPFVAPPPPATATRPKPKSNRWQEDWSPLADPALRTRPFDRLKYLPLVPGDDSVYLSLGATLRDRLETNDAPAFGTGGRRADTYVIQRLQAHADLRLGPNWQVFAQLEDARAPGKHRPLAPVDENKLDLRLGFVAYQGKLGAGTFKARVGRQDFAFDLQRFVSSRDGPNVRQSFDAIWADYEIGKWRFIGFVSQPVDYRSDHPFDDRSGRRWRFHTLRVERQVLGTNELSFYYSRWEQDGTRFVDAAGDERRDIFDLRFAGTHERIDWDLEAMRQTGRVDTARVRAWAVGARTGYTFKETGGTPRIGLQFDAASGDRRARDGRLQTFNPLFPNGYYFSLAGYTGYANIIHLKPTVTVKPVTDLSFTGGVGLEWRESLADAVYVQPNVPVAGTAGRPGRWTGAYFQGRTDWAISDNLSAAVEAVHFDIGDAVRAAGGHSSDYLGVELKFLW